MPARFILVNNEIRDVEKNSELSAFLLNESFRIEQKIWFCHGKIPLFTDNLILLKEQLEFTGFRIPELLQDQRELKRLSHRLINKNKAFLSGLLCISIICNEANVDLIISVLPSDSKNLKLIDKGLLLDYSDQKKYSKNEGNKYRFFNSPIWKSTQGKTTQLNVNGLIILNEKNAITECIESNIFFVKENALITPSPDSGCYLDPLREKILESSIMLGLNTIESNKINHADIVKADEAFLAGESTSMQKITGIGNQRFTHYKTQLINEILNGILLRD